MLREETALALILARVLGDRIRAAREDATAALKDTWRVGDRTSAPLPSGAVVGAVTYAKGRTTATVTDRDAFTEWVAANYPTEVETVTVTRVNAAFEARVLAAAKQAGEPVDTLTGEEFPGVEVRQGDPYPTVRPASDAEALIAAAWKSGELAELVGGLLAVEATTTP